MKLVKKNWLLTAAVSASLAGLAGCNNDNDNDNDIFDKQVKLMVADDQGGDVGSISQYQFSSNSGPGSVERVVNANLAEGIEIDAAGNLYQAGNLASGEGAVQAMCSPTMRTSPVAISANRDRLITSALTSPKGIAIAQKAGYMIIAQSGDGTDAVSVFGTTAANADTAMFSIPRAMVGDSSAWDVVYDEDSDQLFVALTNGDVAYYNDFLSRSADGDYTPTATFNPDNALAATNMHGIVYDAAADRLIVSDVADPTSADDGSIYVFETASIMLSGAVTPDRTIRGAATHLGNPVDLQLNDGDLYVAEKANESGRIMVFNDIATGASGNIAPDADYLVAGPESIVTETVGQMIGNDVSDLSNATVGNLHITSNAANTGTSVYMTDPALTSMGTIFTPVQGTQYVESISLDQNGDAIISFDDAGAASVGGLSFVSRLAMRDAAGSYTDQRDRQITGTNTNLSAPKGVEVVGSYGLVLVADLSATNAIKAFSLCGDGNAAPVFETTMPAGTSPWDLDYDPDADRLYVAATNGTIQVYDDYMANPDAAPARIIDPNDQSGIEASNIHGIVHDSVTNRLIVSDVGSASVADDGRIYVIDNASTADGLTDLRLELAGDNTALGNPVDLAFDGTNLYVAEKSNNQIQRIDNIYALEGVMNRAPDKMMTFTAPESIAIAAQ